MQNIQQQNEAALLRIREFIKKKAVSNFEWKIPCLDFTSVAVDRQKELFAFLNHSSIEVFIKDPVEESVSLLADIDVEECPNIVCDSWESFEHFLSLFFRICSSPLKRQYLFETVLYKFYLDGNIKNTELISNIFKDYKNEFVNGFVKKMLLYPAQNQNGFHCFMIDLCRKKDISTLQSIYKIIKLHSKLPLNDFSISLIDLLVNYQVVEEDWIKSMLNHLNSRIELKIDMLMLAIATKYPSLKHLKEFKDNVKMVKSSLIRKKLIS